VFIFLTQLGIRVRIWCTTAAAATAYDHTIRHVCPLLMVALTFTIVASKTLEINFIFPWLRMKKKKKKGAKLRSLTFVYSLLFSRFHNGRCGTSRPSL
jgi:hypothetical protein